MKWQDTMMWPKHYGLVSFTRVANAIINGYKRQSDELSEKPSVFDCIQHATHNNVRCVCVKSTATALCHAVIYISEECLSLGKAPLCFIKVKKKKKLPPNG